MDWECVVEREQVYRHGPTGILYEVKSLVLLPATFDATARLRPVDVKANVSDFVLRASALCAGSEYERLPDDDGETALWGGAAHAVIDEHEWEFADDEDFPA